VPPHPSEADFRSRRIDLPGRGGAVAVLEFGPQDRPVDVVFSHANSFNALTYRTILGPAARELRILTYDLRGHGSTTLPTRTDVRTGWTDMGEDLAALLEALDLRDLILSGHSMGANVTLMGAAQVPERVRALALFEPVVFPPEIAGDPDAGEPGVTRVTETALRRRRSFPSVEAAMDSFTGRGVFETWPHEMVADYVAGGLRRLPDGTFDLACTPEWEASNYRSQTHDMWPAFERLAPRPMRILKGSTWSSAQFGAGEARLTADGQVKVETIAGTGHFIPMDRPDLVTESLLALRP
jgi:pimeloyl-ACP methyl ester carboxylesterase